LHPEGGIPTLVAQDVAHFFAQQRNNEEFKHNDYWLVNQRNTCWLVSVEVTSNQVAHNETAHAGIGNVGDVFPKPSKAAMHAVVFDIRLDVSVRFGGSIRT
jgi:hypothetical protein